MQRNWRAKPPFANRAAAPDALRRSRRSEPNCQRVDEPTLELLSALLTGDWEAAEATHQGVRTRASGAVGAYVQWHLERGLRGLQHVDRGTP